MRLDKFLQLTKNLNKQEIKTLLKEKRVMVDNIDIVNGKVDIDYTLQVIKVDNKRIEEEPYIYLMMNKSKGVLSALKNETEMTVIDCIKHPRKESLRIMGRLDRDTTGLVILTNNNQLIKHHTMPQMHVEKEYEVELLKPVSQDIVIEFAKGIVIDQTTLLKPAKLTILDDYHVLLIISEGRYHQIKKMFLSVHNQVIHLKRVRIHHLYLDNALAEGNYRPLTKLEINQLTQ